MTATRNQEAQALLGQVGLTRISVKIGSRWIPLLLIAAVTLLFLINNIDLGRKLLAEEFDKRCDFYRAVVVAKQTSTQPAAPSSTPAAPPQSAAPSPPTAPVSEPRRTAAEKPKQPPTLFAECVKPDEPRRDLDAIKSDFRQRSRLSAWVEEFAASGAFTAVKDEILAKDGNWSPLKSGAEVRTFYKAFAKSYFDDLVAAFREHNGAVVKAVAMAALYSLLPGLAGLIYRRAFWPWFGISLVLLLFLKSASEVGSQSGGGDHTNSEQEAGVIFILLVSQIIVLLMANRLRRYARSKSSWLPTKVFNRLLLLVLLAVGVAVAVFDYGDTAWSSLSGTWFLQKLFKWEFILIGLPLLYTLLRQSELWGSTEPKNIVVCLDGTNNTPEQTELGRMAHTNVYKLFRLLKSDQPERTFPAGAFGASLTKSYRDKQIAFYYVGVGNQFENDPIGQALGQAMGLGASGVADRAYLDILRVYRPGDKVYLFGFSRGAAIARLLAHALDQRGAPRSIWTLRLFGRHWTVWKPKSPTRESSRIPVAVLGCWDTVGAFGLAKKVAGIDFQKIDLFKDLSIPDNVEQAYHMVALDEQRDSFVPTLMDPDPINPGRIVEVWFSGDHANIGGGWATPKLSDIPLDFLLTHVSSGYVQDPSKPTSNENWGLYLNAVNVAALPEDDAARSLPNAVDPDPLGQLRQWSSVLYKYSPRKLPVHAVISDRVFERMTRSVPIYAPQSLFDHNEELDKKRAAVGTAVKRLTDTHSLSDAEHQRILEFKDKLRLTRWSQHLENLQTHKTAPRPEVHLALPSTSASVP